MVLAKSFIWIVRILIISIFIAIITTLAAQVNTQESDTTYIRFIETFRITTAHIVEDGQIRVEAFESDYFQKLFGDSLSNTGFLFAVESKDLEVLYNEGYFFSRVNFVNSPHYEIVTGSFVAMYEQEEVLITYQFLVGR